MAAEQKIERLVVRELKDSSPPTASDKVSSIEHDDGATRQDDSDMHRLGRTPQLKASTHH